jgi:hypothetical protein
MGVIVTSTLDPRRQHLAYTTRTVSQVWHSLHMQVYVGNNPETAIRICTML